MTKKTVEDYINKNAHWGDALKKLREIVLSVGLEETIKWGMPVYTAHGQNIVGIAGFKNHFGLWFYQGALLEDAKKILVNAQEGKTKAMRHWRMESAKDIKPTLIKAYIKEAISKAAAGEAIKPDRGKPVVIPAKLKAALASDKKAAAAFKTLTPGKKRDYADYITDAKRDDTKDRRIEKILPMIIKGIGLNDKYKC